MEIDIFKFIIFYFLIIISTTGLGFLSVNLIGKKNENFNLGFIGIIGIFFLILYSIVSHFFFKHVLITNSLIIFLGLVSFIKYLKKYSNKSELYTFFSIFIILFISIIVIKNHDDFNYYHFPYTYYLTKHSLLIGIGNFNHGFRTPSSLFYLNSIFYLPIIKYYIFNIGALMIMGFSNLIILKNIRMSIQLKEFDYLVILNLLSFAFINIFFYRLAEHGTDRSAQILILVFIIEIFYFIKHNGSYKEFFSGIFILLGLIVSLKAFYLLYFIFFIPILYILLNNNLSSKIINLLNLSNNFFNIFCALIIFIFIIYFLNTGCLIYPISFTCFDNLAWTIPAEDVKVMNDWYEQWSKGGATPNFRVEDPETYIQNFNWVKNWIDIYFFNKVYDFILGIIFLIFVFIIIFFIKNNYQKINYKTNFNKNIFIIYFILLILTFEWFYNHPALRYGGYVLLFLLISIPTSIVLEKYFKNLQFIKIRIIYFILIVSLVFVGRNINRMINESLKYNQITFSKVNYQIDESAFRIDKKMKIIINDYNKCMTKKNNCDKILNKKFGKYIFLHQ